MDKPVGPTSHDIVAVVRRAAATRRVGHAGTLDPFASGLLAVLVGRATRLAPFLVGLPKTYTGTIRLGAVTDTDDREGTVLREDQSWQDVTEPALAAGMAALTGRVRQRPPDYSAKKVAGTPAYRRARRGHPVTLAPQEVEVRRFVCNGRDGPDVHFEAEVSSGTYIRALAPDLGESLGCGAHLAALRRTAIGPFDEADAVPASALEPPLPLRPARDAVPHLPETLRVDGRFTEPEAQELLLRTWHLEGLAVRPDHRMTGHTGFLLSARRLAPGTVLPARRTGPAKGAYGADYEGPRPDPEGTEEATPAPAQPRRQLP